MRYGGGVEGGTEPERRRVRDEDVLLGRGVQVEALGSGEAAGGDSLRFRENR